MEYSPKLTRALPKFDMIVLEFSEKLPKFVKDDRCVNLIGMGLSIEYLLSRINGVGNDNDFRDVCFVASLVNATSNSEEFRFSAGDKGHVMNCFDQRLVVYVDMRDQSGNIILDTHIGNYNCCVWGHGSLNSHIV